MWYVFSRERTQREILFRSSSFVLCTLSPFSVELPRQKRTLTASDVASRSRPSEIFSMARPVEP